MYRNKNLKLFQTALSEMLNIKGIIDQKSKLTESKKVAKKKVAKKKVAKKAAPKKKATRKKK